MRLSVSTRFDSGHRQECRGKPLLALEVIVERGLGNPGRLDNLANRRRVVATIRKEPGSHPREMPGHRAHLVLGRHRCLAIDSGAHVMTLKSMKATSLPNGRYCAPIACAQSTYVEDDHRGSIWQRACDSDAAILCREGDCVSVFVGRISAACAHPGSPDGAGSYKKRRVAVLFVRGALLPNP